ncbi:MAG TPA: hypothetical protein VFZ79_11585 [Acidimicrobiales bacterium]
MPTPPPPPPSGGYRPPPPAAPPPPSPPSEAPPLAWPAQAAPPQAWPAQAAPPQAWPAAPPGPPPVAPGYGGPGLAHAGPATTEHGGIGLALVGGMAGAFVAGLAWWGIVATTKYQVTIVAIGVGWVVAQAVLICCQQRNRVPLQAIAGVFTLLSLAASEYFIQRTLFIQEVGDRFGGAGVPLWEGFGPAREVVEESLRDDPLTGLFWLAAAVAAVVVAGTREAVTRAA